MRKKQAAGELGRHSGLQDNRTRAVPVRSSRAGSQHQSPVSRVSRTRKILYVCAAKDSSWKSLKLPLILESEGRVEGDEAGLSTSYAALSARAVQTDPLVRHTSLLLALKFRSGTCGL